MAILLYASGILEEHLNTDKGKPFNQKQLTSLFKDFDTIRSRRLIDVSNTWCLWGENSFEKGNEVINDLGSTIVEEEIHSPLFFIHDSELDSSWHVTDETIYETYPDFVKHLRVFIDDMAEEVRENMPPPQNPSQQLLVLKPISYSTDKRVIHEYDPAAQTEEFYKIENYSGFANQAYNYLEKYFEEQEMLVIYANQQVIIATRFENGTKVLKELLSFFEVRERYEECEVVKGFLERWKKYAKKEMARLKKQKNDKGTDTSK